MIEKIVTSRGSFSVIQRNKQRVTSIKKEETFDPNENLYQILNKIERQSPNNFNSLNANQRNFLFHSVYSNKVASLHMLPYYDPKGEIGFCFGRAEACQLITRRMGLKSNHIGKMFIVGDLKSGDVTEWRFHVTTVVMGDDGEWYAIDPIMSGPITAKEWIEEVRAMWDKKVEAKVYLTPASAVMPDVRTVPAKEDEKGKNLIELSFDPTNKNGFNALPSFGQRVFQVTPANSRRYFLDTEEEQGERFDFIGITINGKKYDYKNYFSDLLSNIHNTPFNEFKPIELFAISGAKARENIAQKSLFSPKWGVK